MTRVSTDTSEKGLESFIVRSLVDEAGYSQGERQDYNRNHAVDLVKLLSFIRIGPPPDRSWLVGSP